jgi:uncharacterized membrane protein YsdA (DUF1294 family)
MQTAEAILYWLPILYMIFMNLAAFIGMWWDKRKAERNEWRVAEATLYILGIMGGAVGIFGGMYRFRHKTQKKSFRAIAIIGLITSLIIYWLIGNLYI